MIATDWTKAPYEVIVPLWRLWLAEDAQRKGQWPLLDRWLKRQLPLFKPYAAKGSAPHKKTASPARDTAAQLSLSAAMFAGMRYLQLAALLEHSYRAQTLELDWSAWDGDWSAVDIHTIPPAAFWYWIALRHTPDACAPAALRDPQARQRWFVKVQQVFTEADAQTTSAMLWQGLRPQWGDLLQARAQTSGWSRDTLGCFLRMQNQSPPLWLRPQGGKTATELLHLLRREGVEAVLDGDGLYAMGGTGLQQTAPYKNGWVEIQDRASQAVAACVAVRPGQKVWDACAGAGGKSLAIAARMNNKGMLLATDLQAYKLEELKRRAKRAGLFNIRAFAWQGGEALRLPVEVARQQGFDWVIVDAPCTSAGTWRRNPDARWRFNPADTSELLAVQQSILASASKAVRPGGHLVYATCSWQVSENEAQVSAFLQSHPAFSLRSQRLIGAPEWNADSMFAAIFENSK